MNALPYNDAGDNLRSRDQLQDHVPCVSPTTVGNEDLYGLLSDCVSLSVGRLTAASGVSAAAVEEPTSGSLDHVAAAAATVADVRGGSQALTRCLQESPNLSMSRGCEAAARQRTPHYVNCCQSPGQQLLLDGCSAVDSGEDGSVGSSFAPAVGPADADASSAADDANVPPPVAPRKSARHIVDASRMGAFGDRQVQPSRLLDQPSRAVCATEDVPSSIAEQPLMPSVGCREGYARDKGVGARWPLREPEQRQHPVYENFEPVTVARTLGSSFKNTLPVLVAWSSCDNALSHSANAPPVSLKSNRGLDGPDGDGDDDDFRPALPVKMGSKTRRVMPPARSTEDGRLMPNHFRAAFSDSLDGDLHHPCSTTAQVPRIASAPAATATTSPASVPAASVAGTCSGFTRSAAAPAAAVDLSNDRVPATRARPSRPTPNHPVSALGTMEPSCSSAPSLPISVGATASAAEEVVEVPSSMFAAAEADSAFVAADFRPDRLSRPESLRLPEPIFPPPSLPPSLMAVGVPPVAPKRKTSKQPAVSETARSTEAPASSSVASCAVGFSSPAVAAVPTACGQAAVFGSYSTVTTTDREAALNRPEQKAAGGSDPPASAEGSLCSHERLHASGAYANDPFRLSVSNLLPTDPFVNAWPVPALRTGMATDVAAPAAFAGAVSELSLGSGSRADHVQEPESAISSGSQWLTADENSKNADDSGRLSDSLPLNGLPSIVPSARRGLTAGIGGDSSFDDSNDDMCSLTDNPLYASWEALDSAWDTGAGASHDESTGDDEEPSVENLAELAGFATTGAAAAADDDARASSTGAQRVQEHRSDGSTSATTPHTPKSIYRAGYLYKQGGAQNNKGWRKRFVTFDGQVLKYFSDKKSRISKKVVPVGIMLGVENDIKETDSNRFRFYLRCVNRVFWFAAETLDDSNLWASTIMQGIIFAKPAGKARGGGLRPGGDMYEPDIRGNLFIDGAKTRRFVAIKGGRLCYYSSFQDFKFASPIHQLDMEIASVKDLGKMKLQLSTPYHQYMLAFSSEEETLEWKTAIEDSIATALSDDTVLNAVYQNEYNQKCFDCCAPNPHWSVLHLVVVVCKKCAGIHRQMWPSTVKSLRMDLRVWTPDLVKLFVSCGNKCASNLWEYDLLPAAKITELTDLHSRQAHLQNKYQRKVYFRAHALANEPSLLNKALLRCVQTGNIVETLQLIHSGANINTRDDEGHSPVDLARAAMQPLQTELLKYVGLGLEQGIVYSQIQCKSMQRIIVKSGYLTELERKEGTRRWAVLDMETMNFYQDENMPTVKGLLRMSEVVSIRKQENEKFLPFFAITLLSDGGKDITLAADSGEGMEAWMESLHKVQAKLLRIADSGDLTSALDPATSASNFTMAGRVFLKEGTGATWRKTWMLLRNKALITYDIDAQKMDQADLRKVVKMIITKQDTPCSLCVDQSGTVLVVDLPNRALYIQSDLRLDTQTWMQAIKRACQENSQSLGDQQLTKDNVAVAVDTCINFISTYAMGIEGIYRLSGSNSGVTHLLESFIKDARSVHLNPELVDAHEVANALKRYLRSLTEPLMTTVLQQQWLDTTTATSDSQRHERYKRLLSRLPSVNYCTLRRLVGHLSRVSDYSFLNKMDIKNLATIFGPLLMTAAGEAMSAAHYTRTAKEISIACQLITNYQSLFEVDKEELEKEQKMGEYIEKLRKAQQESPAALSSPALTESPFILGIYVGTPEGKCVTVKAVVHTTASDVIEKMSLAPSVYSPRDASLAPKDMYAVFELIGSYELERQLDGTEAVLPVTMRWCNWGEAYRRSTCLCVKPSRDLWIDTSSKVFPQSVRYSDVKYSFGKGWKKIYVEVAEGRLLFYKPGKIDAAAKATGWAVCDTTVYLGVEEKRGPPTRFGVTVLPSDTERTGPPNGHSFCFNTEQELQEWMANMRYSKAFASGQCQTARGNINMAPEKSASGVWSQLKALKIPSLFK